MSAPIGAGAAGITWNLNDLYLSAKDPQLQHDLADALARARAFAARYRGKINVAGGPTPELMAAALAEVESLFEQADKPAIFAGLLHAADAKSPEHGALAAATQEQNSAIRNEVVFFDLEWLALDDATAQKIIESPACARYRHHLRRARQFKPHTLTEPEEKLLEETANTGRRSFSRLFDELISSLSFEVDVGGEKQTLNESGVLALLHDARRPVRKNAAKALTQGLERNALVITHVFNTIAQDHALVDRLRGFANPMDSRHLANDIEAASVEALIDASERNTAMVAEYYTLKRGLLGYDQLFDYDRYAPITASSEKIDWSEGRRIVLDAYGAFSPRMREIASLFFEKRWIDAEVRDGKRGGAFSSSTVPSIHPYVLVNYLGTARDVMTVAHELGHGVHQYLSRERGYLQCDTALTMAETASIFGELLIFEALRNQQHDPQARLALLCSFIEDAFSTVFRQIVLTRFEQELHRRRRGQGELSSAQMGDVWHQVNAAMYGDAVTLTDDYCLWWSYIPHFIHSPFYCYAYSFGELLVLALYELYRERGDAFVPQYLDLLAAGGSESPALLLKGIGVDVRDPGFWQKGLDVLRGLVDEAKGLANAASR